MRHLTRTRITFVGCSITLIAASVAMTGCNVKVNADLRVMETTDLHTNVLNYNYYQSKVDDSVGLVKTATLIKKARAEVNNSVLVDNGDLLQGTPLGDYVARVQGLQVNDVHPMYKAMNTLDYDVANIGNHEFNYGLPFLQEAVNDADFPYISANVFYDDKDDNDANDKPVFKPYVIQEKMLLDEEGESYPINIGYIGFVPPQIMQWDQKHLQGKVIAKDMVAMAKKYVPQMKAEGADIIIAIPHSGITDVTPKGLDENSTYYLSKVEGIDAILFGHSHRLFPGDKAYDNMPGVDNEKGLINGVPAVMPGFWGNHLGYVDLKLERDYRKRWRVVSASSVLQPISKRNPDRSVESLVESDQAVLEAVQHDHDAVVEWVNKPFAKISAPINSFFALAQDDPSIQVVTDAQKWYVQSIVEGTELGSLPILSVGAPFKSGYGSAENYTNLAAGDVSYGNVADLYLYPNTVTVMRLNGAQVKEWLERSTGQFNQITPGSKGSDLVDTRFPSYNFDVMDGVQYEIDISQPSRYQGKEGELTNPEAERIVNLRFNDKPINPAQEFLVVTNNYRSGGGGNFPGISEDNLVISAPDENRQAIANFLTEMSAANPEVGFDPSADGNWRFKTLPDTTVTFKSSGGEAARTIAEQSDRIQYQSTDAEGYGIYSLDLSR